MTCRATRRWRRSRSTIPSDWNPATRSLRCARSATIHWRGCTRIVRSMKRNIRAVGFFRTTGNERNAGHAPSILRVNMSMAGQAREPITEGQRRAVLRLNRAERELGADGSALVHDILILGMTMEQIGQRRELGGRGWLVYFPQRFSARPARLANVYRISPEPKQNIC